MIRLHKPRLPPFLDEVTIIDLRLGNAKADLRIQRDRKNEDDVLLEILRSEGMIQISVAP